MPRTTFAGHPLHPQLIPIPSALIPAATVFDALYTRTGNPSYREAAYYALAGGVAGGVAAAAAGALDYLSIPSGSHSKRVANTHAALNLGILALGILSLRSRDSGRAAPPEARSMVAVAAGAVIVSAWYGGHLVYEHGLRVKGVDPLTETSDLRLPGDAELAERLATADQQMTSRGLSTVGSKG